MEEFTILALRALLRHIEKSQPTETTVDLFLKLLAFEPPDQALSEDLKELQRQVDQLKKLQGFGKVVGL